LPELELHFLEISKMPQLMYNKATQLEKWLLFLSRPKQEILEELAMSEDVFKKAYEKLKFLSQDSKERVKYEARIKYLLDKDAEIECARDEGKAEGKAEGIEEGMAVGLEKGKAEGQKETNLTNVRKMKEKGFAVAAIIEITRLTEEEIQAL